MKLLRVNIISGTNCGGLLDGLDVSFRSPFDEYSTFAPLCFIGRNGAGKSQFLQILAEIFQSTFHKCVSHQERYEGNLDLQFEIEYFIHPENELEPIRVRISHQSINKKRPSLIIETRDEYNWIDCDLNSSKTHALLPEKIVGYTSGDNETLSLPFLTSRSGYATDVREKALSLEYTDQSIPDTRLMLIDYGTHLEVLVANLLLGSDKIRAALLDSANLQDLHSFRCIIQLAHGVVSKFTNIKGSQSTRKEIQLTQELETFLDRLKRCATCYTYDEKTETYIFDYWINDQTRAAFRYFWDNSLELYSAFHKLSMLNDLALPRKTRERFQNDTKKRRFASRLPEPQDEDKVFRFERVNFRSRKSNEVVDYVSLSDGEHQLAQLLGTFCMFSSPNILFLLDEPESHFNPQWRVQFISKILDLPTENGDRRGTSIVSHQDCLITTHAPFIPSDMHREQVFMFSKNDEGEIQIKHPDIETFGATFDTIIEECFGVSPPISQVPRDEIEELMKSENPEEIRSGIRHLGNSVEKAFLADHLRQLQNKGV
ncbi:MAG: restriction system-associated AAA family ATPase [Pseudanabaena sp. CAN_BIN31]|nr:restriction system-associated AAA family ATPase [Pseudanabaena sp. CAN_BIN31]